MLKKLSVVTLCFMAFACGPKEKASNPLAVLPKSVLDQNALQSLMEKPWLSQTILKDILPEDVQIAQGEQLFSQVLFLELPEIMSQFKLQLDALYAQLVQANPDFRPEIQEVLNQLDRVVLKNIATKETPLAYELSCDQIRGSLKVSADTANSYIMVLDMIDDHNQAFTIRLAVSHEPALKVSLKVNGLNNNQRVSAEVELTRDRIVATNPQGAFRLTKKEGERYSVTIDGESQEMDRSELQTDIIRRLFSTNYPSPRRERVAGRRVATRAPHFQGRRVDASTPVVGQTAELERMMRGLRVESLVR